MNSRNISRVSIRSSKNKRKQQKRHPDRPLRQFARQLQNQIDVMKRNESKHRLKHCQLPKISSYSATQSLQQSRQCSPRKAVSPFCQVKKKLGAIEQKFQKLLHETEVQKRYEQKLAKLRLRERHREYTQEQVGDNIYRNDYPRGRNHPFHSIHFLPCQHHPSFSYLPPLMLSPLSFLPANMNPQNNLPYPNYDPFQFHQMPNSIDNFQNSYTNVKRRVFTAQQTKSLRKKLRLAGNVVYFCVAFRPYCTTLKNRRFEFSKKISLSREGMELKCQGLNELFEYDYYDAFRKYQKIDQQKINKKYQSEEQSLKNKDNILIKQNGFQYFLSAQTTNNFITEVLGQFQSLIQNDKLQSIYDILIHVLPQNFGLNRFFLSQQLRFLEFSQKDGSITSSSNKCKLLFINYIFIKAYLFPLLRDDVLAENIKNSIRKNPKNKKFILIHGKKMKISVIILYEMLNVIFDQNSRMAESNYKKLLKHIRVKKMKQLVHNFVFGESTKISKVYRNSVKLIKGIVSNMNLLKSISNNFEENWLKIIQITEILYKKVEDYNKIWKYNLKKEVLSKKFDYEPIKIEFSGEKDKDYEELSEENKQQIDELAQNVMGDITFKFLLGKKERKKTIN